MPVKVGPKLIGRVTGESKHLGTMKLTKDMPEDKAVIVALQALSFNCLALFKDLVGNEYSDVCNPFSPQSDPDELLLIARDLVDCDDYEEAVLYIAMALAIKEMG